MSVSKKEIRQQRLRRKRQQRRATVLGVIGVVVVLIVLFALPSIIDSLRPAGSIVQVIPVERVMVDGLAMGDPAAPVVVEVFEDFQCPMCRVYSDEVETQIMNTYVATGQVYYIFRHYPFLDNASGTNESDQAANASMCANEQGQFWAYHDVLFANWNSENQGSFRDKRLVAFAEFLELDMTAFNDCFKENRYEEQINADLAKGQQLGIGGTPSVFVNGEVISPGFVPTFEDVQLAIEAQLAIGR